MYRYPCCGFVYSVSGDGSRASSRVGSRTAEARTQEDERAPAQPQHTQEQPECEQAAARRLCVRQASLAALRRALRRSHCRRRCLRLCVCSSGGVGAEVVRRLGALGDQLGRVWHWHQSRSLRGTRCSCRSVAAPTLRVRQRGAQVGIRPAYGSRRGPASPHATGQSNRCLCARLLWTFRCFLFQPRPRLSLGHQQTSQGTVHRAHNIRISGFIILAYGICTEYILVF